VSWPGCTLPGELIGRAVHPGEATGEPLVLDAPLSFWGGTDHHGTIVDEHHPQCGARLTGRVVVLPTARGSSSSSSVLAEQIRASTAPAALVLTKPDAILMLGAWVAAELYGRRLPIVVLAEPEYRALCRGSGPVTVTAGPERATISGAVAPPRTGMTATAPDSGLARVPQRISPGQDDVTARGRDQHAVRLLPVAWPARRAAAISACGWAGRVAGTRCSSVRS
jgi:hypothetical protein